MKIVEVATTVAAIDRILHRHGLEQLARAPPKLVALGQLQLTLPRAHVDSDFLHRSQGIGPSVSSPLFRSPNFRTPRLKCPHTKIPPLPLFALDHVLPKVPILGRTIALEWLLRGRLPLVERALNRIAFKLSTWLGPWRSPYEGGPRQMERMGVVLWLMGCAAVASTAIA